MLFLRSNNTHSFVHDKSSSTAQLIKGKLSDLQKLFKYLGGTVTSTFKVGTRGRAGRPASPSFPGYGGLFPVIFVLYLNDLPSEELLLILVELCTSSL